MNRFSEVRTTSAQSVEKGPVFVCGMNGSGTWVVLDCLNSHPELYGFPRETKVLPSYISALPKYGDLNDDENFRRLWQDLLDISVLNLPELAPAPTLPEHWRDLPRDIGAIFDWIMRYFAGRDGKRRWCEKTPMHALHLATLARVFPNAKFIHMIRDGRDCALSNKRRWGYAPQRTIWRWKHLIREAAKQGAMLPNQYMEVHYETLTEDPEAGMRQICAFLEVPFDPVVLTPSRQRPSFATRGATFFRNSEKWRGFFSDRELHALERIAGRLLAEQGYPTDQPDGDFEPPAVLLHWWRLRDEMGRLLWFLRVRVKRYGVFSPMLVAQMVKTIRSAAQQRSTTKF